MRLRFADPASYERARVALGAARADERLRTLELPTDGTAVEVHAALDGLLAAGLTTPEVSIDRPSLDDVFLHLTDRRPTTPELKEAA
jgi:ABC-2 type transport system ATP-binding protein